jgi:hypothetical protein
MVKCIKTIAQLGRLDGNLLPICYEKEFTIDIDGNETLYIPKRVFLNIETGSVLFNEDMNYSKTRRIGDVSVYHCDNLKIPHKSSGYTPHLNNHGAIKGTDAHWYITYTYNDYVYYTFFSNQIYLHNDCNGVLYMGLHDEDKLLDEIEVHHTDKVYIYHNQLSDKYTTIRCKNQVLHYDPVSKVVTYVGKDGRGLFSYNYTLHNSIELKQYMFHSPKEIKTFHGKLFVLTDSLFMVSGVYLLNDPDCKLLVEGSNFIVRDDYIICYSSWSIERYDINGNTHKEKANFRHYPRVTKDYLMDYYWKYDLVNFTITPSTFHGSLAGATVRDCDLPPFPNHTYFITDES